MTDADIDDAAMGRLAIALARATTLADAANAFAADRDLRQWMVASTERGVLYPLCTSDGGPKESAPVSEDLLQAPRVSNPSGASTALQWFDDELHVTELQQRDGARVILLSAEPIAEPAQALLRAAAARFLSSDDRGLFRDRALSTISHDLRGPLNVIGFAGSMLQSSVGDSEKELVTKIRRAARTMEGMIRDLLDLGELEAGRLELNLGEVPVRTIVGHVDAAVEAMVAESDMTYEKDIADPDAMVRADGTRLAQALSLLIGNSCRHAKRGTVRLRAEARDGAIWFEVEDTGSPLSESARAHLFAPSSRGEEADPRAKGLGLTLARRLVEAHEGTLSAEPSEGVSIAMRIPAA